MELEIKNRGATNETTTHSLKRIIFLALILALTLTPLISAPTAHAATTTTKYLNGKIAFDSDRDGNGEIYIMNADGSNQARLTNNSAYDYNSSWSPDGTKIAFYSNRDGNAEIYTMNADGSNQTRITNNSAYDYNPSWSPDGTKLAFTTTRDGNPELYTMNADGSNQTRLTNNAATDNQAFWSPDGTKLAFYSDRDGNFEIYTMNADGSNQTRITNDTADDYGAVWSPDGTTLAFITNRGNPPSPYNPDIYTMSPDGSNVARITNTAVVEDSVSYSPDGTKFLSTIYPDANYNSSNVFTMNLDGSNRVQLTNNATSYDEAYGPEAWQKLPYTQTQNDNGTITSTIATGSNYTSTDYTVQANETLVLDGQLCNVTVQSGGTLQGTGSIAPNCTLTVEPGGILAPGLSPGCLASGNVTLSGTYQAELAGTTACSGYDQLQVTGTVNLTGSTLTTSLLNGYVPTAGDSFTLITNDSTDPVTGSFQNLPEGATVTIGSTVFKVSYTGGDGNDVVLTAQSVPGAPETGYEKMTLINVFLIMFSLSILGIIGFIAIRKFKREYI